MAAYVLADIDVHDAATFEQYRVAVPPLIARHGGEYLIRGGAVDLVEGNWRPKRFVLIRFPDKTAARAFLDDPDYQPVAALRFRSATTDLVVIEGA
jgi:uncharacterized protein (DUF1330 family)